MASPFAGFEVDEALRPQERLLAFDLDQALDSVVALEAQVSEAAYSARTLGTNRIGNAVVIGAEGLMLTIGYLVTEADEVTVTTNAGARIDAHVLGIDSGSGLGLVHALEPLGLPALAIGQPDRLHADAPLISAGGGGRSHALAGRLVAREPFAGYWEYLLDEALFVEPAHPHWSGAALLDAGGGLIGIGSLRMEQHARGGEVSPLNMFVPTALLAPIQADLVRGLATTEPRPWLGVYAQEVSAHVVVLDVAPGGPASRAELRRGDVIHRIAGQPVRDLAAFYRRLWALGPPGVLVPLTVQRERDVFDVEIRSFDRTALQRKRRLN